MANDRDAVEHSRSHSILRTFVVAGAVAGVVGVLFIAFGTIGYNPTDDGNVLAQTLRLLHGQVPHRDLIFARPMGSALFHLIDWAVPLPLFEASRLVGLLESALYSLLLAWLVYRRPPTQWKPWHVAGAIGALVVNMHTFFLEGWYTTDGLLFCAAGFLLLSRRNEVEERPGRYVGLFLLGVAPIMKQSFAPATLVGILWVALEQRRSAARFWRAMVPSFLAAVLPITLYVGVVSVLGGGSEFFRQIAGAHVVWGYELLSAPVKHGSAVGVLLIALAGLLACLFWVSRHAATSEFPVVIRAAIAILFIAIVVSGRLRYAGTWGLSVFWASALLLVYDLAVHRRFDRPLALVLLLGWMVSLSWGYPLPNLVAGSIILGALRVLVIPEMGRSHSSFAKDAGFALAVAIALLFVAVSFQARRQAPYFDSASPTLTRSLRSVSPRFGSIRTDPSTYSYLASMAACIRSHPAHDVAVLPDNPGIYPAFGLRNPFPIDWMFPDEIRGEESRILDRARSLDRSGDYLVLFQTFGAQSLAFKRHDERAGAGSVPFDYGTGLSDRILSELHGARVFCGPFIGVYSRT